MAGVSSLLVTVTALWLSSLVSPSLGENIPCPLECSCYNTKVHCMEPQLLDIPQLPTRTEYLYISGNNIEHLGAGSFHNLSQLKELFITHTKLRKVDMDAFQGLTQLQNLVLAYNRLDIHSFGSNAEIFRPLRVTLKSLDLSGNHFSLVPHSELKLLTRLQKLNVSRNALTSAVLGSGFISMDQLQVLDLSHNNLKTIAKLAFQQFSRHSTNTPKTIDLSYCQLDTIEKGAFSNLPMLGSLNLSGNQRLSAASLTSLMGELGDKLKELILSKLNLTTVGDMFRPLQVGSLETLDLSHNLLETIQDGKLKYLGDLKTLNLAGNKLRHLSSGTFVWLKELTTLNLDNNRLESWSPIAFESILNLKSLYASGNRFAKLDVTPFTKLYSLTNFAMNDNQITGIEGEIGNLQQLKKLSLSGNSFASLDNLNSLLNLEHLDMSYNKLERLLEHVFPSSSTLKVFNVSHNRITEVHPRAFSNYSPLTIDLSYNRIELLPNMRWEQVTFLSFSHNLIEHIPRNAFSETQLLKSLDLSHNFVEKFPETMFVGMISLREFYVSHNRLSSFAVSTSSSFARPANNVQLSLQKLDLSQNQILNIRAGFFSNLTNLQILDLSGNLLGHLDEGSFTGLGNVEQINLSMNKLTSPDPKVFENAMPRLSKLDASKNPFTCDCSLIPFLTWKDTEAVHFVNYEKTGEYTCAKPENRKSMDLKDTSLSNDNCQSGIAERTIILIVIGCTAFVILVAVSVLFWQHRWRLKRRLKKERYRAMYEASNQNGKDSSDQSDILLQVQQSKGLPPSHLGSPHISNQGTPRGQHEKLLPGNGMEMSPRSNRYNRDTSSVATTYAPVGSQCSGSDRSHFSPHPFEVPPPPPPAPAHFEASPYFPHCGLGARRMATNNAMGGGIHPGYTATALSSSGGSSCGRGGSSHSQISGYSTPDYQPHSTGRDFV